MNIDLVSLVVKLVREMDGQKTARIPEDLGIETQLFGREGILDSLGLVTLVVAVEQAIEDEYGVSISLTDEKAMSQKHSPYRTIGALAAYANHLVEQAA